MIVETEIKSQTDFISIALNLKNNGIEKIREIEEMLDVELGFHSLGYCSAGNFSLLGIPETTLYCIVKIENKKTAVNLINKLIEKYHLGEFVEIE